MVNGVQMYIKIHKRKSSPTQITDFSTFAFITRQKAMVVLPALSSVVYSIFTSIGLVSECPSLVTKRRSADVLSPGMIFEICISAAV